MGSPTAFVARRDFLLHAGTDKIRRAIPNLTFRPLLRFNLDNNDWGVEIYAWPENGPPIEFGEPLAEYPSDVLIAKLLLIE